MASVDLFDSELEGGNQQKPNRPAWTLKLDPKEDGYNEKEVLSWLTSELAYLRRVNRERFSQIERNLALFKGIQYQSQETRNEVRGKTDKRKVEKIVFNELRQLTRDKVARLIKYKPAVAVMASNDDEYKDKLAAKWRQRLIDHHWYVQGYEDHVEREIIRYSKIMGEAYLWTEWDADRGELHPDFVAAKQKQEKIPLLDDDDNPIKDSDGKPMYIEDEVRLGDVGYELKTPFDSLLQRKKRFEDVEYAFKVKQMPVELARLLYPKVGGFIHVSKPIKIYDFETMEVHEEANMVEVVYWYHRKMRGCQDGRWIVFTPDVICSNKKYPYSHKDKAVGQLDLPFERLTDIDVPEELHGQSFFQDTAGITGTYNNLTNMTIRNQYLVSHPKWMLPVGSADVTELGNDITIVRFKGPVAPQLVQASPTSPEIFKFRSELKEEALEKAGLGPIGQGEPPPGIKAGIALQYLGENEDDRANEEVVKVNAFRKGLAYKTLGVCDDFYDDSDKRSIKIRGRNNSWMGAKLQSTKVEGGYDVLIQDTSALPKGKAARMQTLFDLNEKFPNQVTGEQVLDMIDLAQNEKFITMATVSTRAAEAENDGLLDGQKVPAPEEWEGLLAHWRVHSRQLMEYQFKHKTPEPIQIAFKDHLMATEHLMFEKSKANAVFGAEVAKLEQFPLLFKPEPPPPPMPAPGPDGAGAPMDTGSLPPPGEAPPEPPFGMPDAPANPDDAGGAGMSPINQDHKGALPQQDVGAPPA